MTSLKGKLSYANVAATIALVLAVAGIPSAAAITAGKVKKNSITSKQIKPGAIRASDLAGGAVTAAKIADGNVTAPKLAGTHLATDEDQSPGPGQALAVCPASERMLGGGASTGGAAIHTSAPVGIGQWRVFAESSNFTTAYALCLKAAPGP